MSTHLVYHSSAKPVCECGQDMRGQSEQKLNPAFWENKTDPPLPPQKPPTQQNQPNKKQQQKKKQKQTNKKTPIQIKTK